MKILITGAAGNLGSLLTRHLFKSRHHLNLMMHNTPLPKRLQTDSTSVIRADLADPTTLPAALNDVSVVVHFAGRLFAPRPETFLQDTNVTYVQNLVDAAIQAGVDRLILVSFPHVEGESTPEHPAKGNLDGNPISVHARTRLSAEKYLFSKAAGTQLTPVALRPGMIYARGVLMIDAARWLLKRRLLGVWRAPTWIHPISLPDFLSATTAAIEGQHIRGIYNLGDDKPLTLQRFLDQAALQWGCPKPWRAPMPLFYLAASLVEIFSALTRKPAPLTRDFIRIGSASYVTDTSRMKAELLPRLSYPDFETGLVLL